MFYIIVTEQDHQESFVGYVPPLPVEVWNVGAFRKDGPGDQRWKLWGWGYQPLECGPYRGESWFRRFSPWFPSVFYLLIMYEGSVIVIVFHVASKHVSFYFFTLILEEMFFGDVVPTKPPPRSSGDSNPAQLMLARLASPWTVVIISSSFFPVHLPKDCVWGSISGKCWVHPGFMYIIYLLAPFTLPNMTDSIIDIQSMKSASLASGVDQRATRGQGWWCHCVVWEWRTCGQGCFSFISVWK